ncbi:MAG: DUF3800 domain-containing protein [Acidobacteria bacterium]|nr:DUF3800 domain-containing protein [Acidobacteriota bacterium]
MKEAEEKPRWYFVDEAGDPAFYAKRSKRVIVGEEGCSRTLILGFIRTYDPQQIRSKLAEVRLAVSTDRYLKDIPSVAKSLIHFHAKDDCPEVRKLVFDAIEKMDFHAQVVVARKREQLFRTKYGSSELAFYDDLITKLFKNQLHLSAQNSITFARRGTKARQHALRAAVEKGAEEFRKKFKHETVTKIVVETSQPIQEPALQAADYVNWAVQRAFEKGEMRYFEFLRQKIEVVWDVFDFEKYESGGCIYDRKKNPFDIKKASPLS